MEITSYDRITGDVQGRYKYEGKSEYLDLKGTSYGSVVVLQEYYNGNQTGEFFLTVEPLDGQSLYGKWVGSNGNVFDVDLGYTDFTYPFSIKSLTSFNKETNSDLSGVYGTETYYINDMWFTEDNPLLEVGFGGGYLALDPIDEDSLWFEAEFIVGPTYHFAYAKGIAINKDTCFVYKNEDGCVIEIWTNPSKKEVYIKGGSSMDCGFGARAHMDHHVVKVSDTIPSEEFPTLRKILGRDPYKK